MIQTPTKSFLGSFLRWLTRLALLIASGAIFWFCKLILAGVLYLVNTLPVMQASLNALPEMKQTVDQLQIDVQSIKKNAVTEAQMTTAINAAEQRVNDGISQKFRKELEKVKNKGRIAPDGYR